MKAVFDFIYEKDSAFSINQRQGEVEYMNHAIPQLRRVIGSGDPSRRTMGTSLSIELTFVDTWEIVPSIIRRELVISS